MARRRLKVGGKTFAAFARTKARGYRNPNAVAAFVFRRKYGTKTLARAAARGRRRAR